MITKDVEESNKHYEYYLVYQNMGYKRTLKKTAEEVELSVREIEKVSSRYGWVSRVDKFDKQQAQIRYNAMKTEIQEMGKRQGSHALQMTYSLITPAQELLKRLKEKKELDFSNLSDVDLVAIVSKIAHPFKLLTEVERVAKGQITKDNIDQSTNIEDDFIKRIGQDQESAELATRLLSKIKDSN